MSQQKNPIDFKKALQYYEQNKLKFLEDLQALVRIPSVSFDGFPREQVQNSAKAVAELLKLTGLENVQILELDSLDVSAPAHPYVYGEWLKAPGKPTLLLYAHHDVQPPGREELWKSPPFEPSERQGRLYGRGTADDKAGVVIHTAAITSFLNSCGTLPINVKLIVEGEEEIGSPHLKLFLQKYKDLLKADAMVLTDTQNFDTGVPAITVSLRGLVVFDIEVKALKSPKHSGMWGGPVPDPTVALCKMLASCVDEQGRLCIPGIWDEVRPLLQNEKQALDALPFGVQELRYQAEFLKDTWILPARDGTVKPLTQMWREPSFSINAFQASSRKLASNVINDSAWARVGIRTVADMSPQRTVELVIAYLNQTAPWGVEVNITPHVSGGAWSTNPQGPYFEAALRALEKGFKTKPVLMGCGGSIPFVEPMVEVLGGIPALLIGVEDPYTNAHSENESVMIEDFEKSIRSAIYFYSEF